MINPNSNVITVISIAIMPMNVGRNIVTWVIDLVLILLRKISVKKYIFLACNMVEENNEDIWFIDSRCCNHMTGNISMFSLIDENVKSQVTLRTDSKVSVMGKGRVSVLTKKGERRSISDVYYVACMKCNLLSI